MLYRDLAYRHGPLSPHLNALAFGLAGDSLSTLVWLNLAILAAIAAMTWLFFRDAAGRPAASAACAVLLGVFAFSQYTPIANYNYVTPYQHPLTHGLALSLGMLLALGRARRRGGAAPFAVAGLCLGGTLLTKAELALPALLAAGLGVALAPREARPAGRIAILAAAALLPGALAAAALARHMPGPEALAATLGNLGYLGPELLRDGFYARVAGTDEALRNLGAMARELGWIAGFVGLAALAERLAPPALRRRLGFALAAAGLFAVLSLGPSDARWLELARALPAALALGLVWVAAARARAAGPERERLSALGLWGLWSLALLAKMALHVRFGHYGFALAMPATLWLVALLVGWLPARLAGAAGGGQLARALALAAIAAGVLSLLRVSDGVYARKTLRVGEGGDALWAEGPRARRVERARERLEVLMPAAATLLVLPDGISFNYFLRRRNPTRFYLFVPPEIAAFGQDAMLAELRAHPADFVALVHRGHREFGVGPFGRDPRNGRALLDWVRRDYERIERIGAEPFGHEGFGVVLLRRRAAAAP